eukprot:3506069-Pleurochrysis_carterae.AAC.4
MTLLCIHLAAQVCTVALSMLLGDSVSSTNLLGLVLCILGAGVYHAKKSRARSRTIPATQLSTAQTSFKDTDADLRVSGSCGLTISRVLTNSGTDGVATMQASPKRLARVKRPFQLSAFRTTATATHGQSVSEMARMHAADCSRANSSSSLVNGVESSRANSGDFSRVSGCDVPRARERLLASRGDACFDDDARQSESYSYV